MRTWKAMKDKIADKKPFTKSRLVKELSWACELPQTKIKSLLETLAEIARREAHNTFILPGMCKLEIVRRKPRKVRNPRTGETFTLPERDALRITAPRSLKLAFAKPVEQPAPTAETAAQETAAQAEKEDSAPQPPVDPNALISFRCPRCRQEVEATGDMVGFETECPTCGNPIKVPAQSEPGTVHAAASNGDASSGDAPGDEALVRHAKTVSSHEAESLSPEKLKGLTIRINVDELGLGNLQKADDDPSSEQMVSFVCTACQQEIEASRDMVGETTACPNCGAPLVVPAESASNTLHDTSHEIDPKIMQAMKGRTMRIDMGEDF